MTTATTLATTVRSGWRQKRLWLNSLTCRSRTFAPVWPLPRIVSANWPFFRHEAPIRFRICRRDSHALLVDLYPDSAHVRELGMRDSTDTEIWEYAAIHTFDLDPAQSHLCFPENT